jgi:hypothetical protein
MEALLISGEFYTRRKSFCVEMQRTPGAAGGHRFARPKLRLPDRLRREGLPFLRLQIPSAAEAAILFIAAIRHG